jgi:hypothetical protein
MTKLLGENPRIASTEDIEGFAACWTPTTGTSCCDIDSFRIDLTGPPRSLWNQSAALVFAKEFLRVYDMPLSDAKFLTKAFFTRVKSLRLKHIQKLAGPVLREEQSKAVRRVQRKQTVSDSELH